MSTPLRFRRRRSSSKTWAARGPAVAGPAIVHDLHRRLVPRVLHCELISFRLSSRNDEQEGLAQWMIAADRRNSGRARRGACRGIGLGVPGWLPDGRDPGPLALVGSPLDAASLR